MTEIHKRNSTIMIKPSQIQGLMQDLSFTRKSIARHIDSRIVDEMNFDA